MERRDFLAAGLSGAVALAGCTQGGDDEAGDSGADGGTGGGSPTETNGASPTGTDTNSGRATLETHPAGRALDAQPRLGPDPAAATGVIVAFEDPSCPSCARFEREVVPEIRSNLVEPGDVSLVFRGYPVIYPWGEQGVRALEATFDRSADAFWSLSNHYFENQSAFRGRDPGEVYARTESYLASETDVDAKAVVSAAEGGDYDDAVQTDLDAGMAAGAGQRTPHLFLFRDGTYRTKVSGLVTYSVIESALEL
ncbi:MAG: DsbA family protein [Haloglomus sp.]